MFYDLNIKKLGGNRAKCDFDLRQKNSPHVQNPLGKRKQTATFPPIRFAVSREMYNFAEQKVLNNRK